MFMVIGYTRKDIILCNIAVGEGDKHNESLIQRGIIRYKTHRLPRPSEARGCETTCIIPKEPVARHYKKSVGGCQV